jgi:chromosome segregation ATPase
MQVAADHEATVNGRAAELKAIADAKNILTSTTSVAEGQTYSLLQVRSGSMLKSRADLANAEVVTLEKQLAQTHHSAALAQLASRIAAVMRLGTSGSDDPFAKVKDLISQMITKLEEEADAEATEKAWCDEQIAKTEEKKVDLESDIAKLTAKIDVASAKSADLKNEVKELQAALAALAKLQAEMDNTRQESHAAFVQAKADLELGLQGVRQALTVLREYYGGSAAFMQQPRPAMPELHSKAEGAGNSIVGILEVVESDFAQNLAKETTEEDDAEAEYQKITQENAVTKTMKDQDVKYKTQEYTGLDKNIADMTADRETADTELSAVMDYYSKVKDRCIAKPETYETRKARREAEINGLKQALSILEDETAFVQRGKKSALRGRSLSL